ncbi:MAG: T9SS type A sorting domain-containing protein, partial [Bacteroidetes bacterium]|nr:T9SS type A sorting domain-containing protein [Bacteroidota bacterium]
PIESVELFNLLGQRVLVKKAGFQNEMELDVSFLSSGTYLLNVIIDGKIGTFKVIKE